MIKMKRLKPMNKKGNFIVWFFVLIVIMAFSVFALVLNKTWSEIETPLEEAISDNTPTDTDVNITSILGGVGDTSKNFSNMLPFLIIGLLAFILITAGALLKHPVMIFVGIIVLGVLILIAVTFSNIYETLGDSEAFAETDEDLAIQGSFMDYLPVILLVLAVGVAAAVIYSKSGGGAGI